MTGLRPGVLRAAALQTGGSRAFSAQQTAGQLLPLVIVQTVFLLNRLVAVVALVVVVQLAPQQEQVALQRCHLVLGVGAVAEAVPGQLQIL